MTRQFAQGVKLPEEWHSYSQFSVDTLPLPTKYLSGGQVLKFRDDAFNNYYNDPAYLEMINVNFGEKTVSHIKAMCEMTLERKYYDYQDDVKMQAGAEA